MPGYNHYENAQEVPKCEIDALRTDPSACVHVFTKKGASRYITGEIRRTWTPDGKVTEEFRRFVMYDGRKWSGLTDELAQVFDPALHARRMERKAKRANKRNAAHDIGTGAIFYTSWGYEQTNIEWFEVVKTTAKTVTLRSIASAKDYKGSMSGTTTPRPGCFVDDFNLDDDENANGIRRNVRNFGHGGNDSWGCKIDDLRNAWLWDGKPKYFSEWY